MKQIEVIFQKNTNRFWHSGDIAHVFSNFFKFQMLVMNGKILLNESNALQRDTVIPIKDVRI